MKKTLALLIAVLMVVAMLPLSILTAAAEEPAENLFAVYDEADELVGTYATLAEADAVLDDDYTLRLLGDYEADAAYVWGAAREEVTPISFTIDGNDYNVHYTGEGALWTFGGKYAGGTIILENVYLSAAGGAEAVAVCEGACVVIESGKFESNGPAVVRTVAGASANVPATLVIYGGEFMLHPSESVDASYAVVTNGDAGDVYIYAGMFMNNNDTVIGTVCSEYTLKHTAASGDFRIFGGMMLATGMQKGFYKPADTSNTEGVSLPTTELPIIKGVTSSYNLFGREFYYTAYGAAEDEALLVPTVSPAAQIVIGEEANALGFVTKVGPELAAAINTWARAKAYELGVDPDAEGAYTVKYATLITDEDTFLMAGGSFYALDIDDFFFVYADEDNTTVNEDGSFEYVAVTAEIPVEMKEMRVVAINVLEIYIDENATPDDLTDDYSTLLCGEFNLTTGLASMSVAAATALRDNAAEATGAYQYPSITVAQAFNRYTEAEQQILMEYLAHEHDFNYLGECADEDCLETICETLDEGDPSFFYTENGSKQVFEIELEEGVRYAIGLNGDTASYQLYDADGNACTVTNGIVEPAATGTYYLNVNGEKTGSYIVIFSHIHNVNHLGDCAICEENVAAPATVGANNYWVAVKGNTYVLSVELEAGVAYAMRSFNGSFTLYNAAGEEMVVENNTFVCPEEGAGTYYIMVDANYTGTVTVQIAHFHQYDYTGLCAHCGDYLGVTLDNVYTYSTPRRVEVGEQLYMNIRLQEGKTYKIVASSYVGSFKLYNAEGVEQTLASGGVFECAADGVYYLVVSVQTETNAQFRFEVEHGAACTYNNKGECEFTHINNAQEEVVVSCGKTERNPIVDGATKMANIGAGAKSYFYLNYASSGVTYNITITGGVSYTFYKADGTELTNLVAMTENGVTTVTYTASADAVIYLVLENTGDTGVASDITVAHVHQIDHRGQCTVKNTTTGQTPTTCVEKQVTNMSVDTPLNVTYVTDGIYRYAVTLMAGVEYKVVLENADATWVLKNADGTTVYSSDNATDPFIPTVTTAYYLVVTATADTVADPAAVLTIVSHTHSFNNKGECVGEDCEETFNKKVLEVDVEYDGYLATGNYFFNVELEAGYTYLLTFTAEGVTYTLYGGENADTEMTLTDGAFTCAESGTYYYVVTVSEDIPAHETYMVETVIE